MRKDNQRLDVIKCNTDGNKKVFIKKDEIKERWEGYFNKLFSEGHVNDSRCLANSTGDANVNHTQNYSIIGKDCQKS